MFSSSNVQFIACCMEKMYCLYLFLFVSMASIVKCQQLDDDEEQAVTMLPSDADIVVRLDQDLMLTCRIEGPQVTNCSWQINGAAPSRALEMAIENRHHQSKRYGKCRIVMKVTQQDVGQWTCHMFTDETNHPQNATKHVSLFHRSSSADGLVTIIMLGLILLLSYVGSFALQKVCKFDHHRWEETPKRAPLPTSTSVISIKSRESSQCENSDDYGDDIAMTTSPNPAIDRP